MHLSETAILWILGVFLALLNAFCGYVIAGLKEQLNLMRASMKAQEARLIEHREDVIKNYVTDRDLESAKKDIIGRIDRMEQSVVSLVTRGPKGLCD